MRHKQSKATSFFADLCFSLAWSQVGGHSVIPKSVTPSRIKDNFKEVELSNDDIKTIDKIGDKPRRYNIPYIASKSKRAHQGLILSDLSQQTSHAGQWTFSVRPRRRRHRTGSLSRIES